MRNLSSNWKEKVKSGMDVQYLKYADITLADGTVLNLTSADLWQNGMAFEDSVSGDNSFDIGSAIVNVLTLSINNFDGKYSDYDFEGAEVVCYIGLRLEDEDTSELLDSAGEQILDSTGDTIIVHKNAVIEKTRICTVTVVEQPEDETVTIDLTCEDNMRKFDRNYSDSKLKYPATRGQIVRDACEVCGVTLQTYNFDHDDYIVQTRPSDDALTFRQVLQWVAQIGCQWLRCDEYGRLCVKWYDTEKTDVQEIDTTYSFTPQHTDVVITGIQVTEYSDSSDEEPESYTAGTQGYVLVISDNKLIRKGDGQTVASMIAEKCVGMIFRPFESECPTDVALEAGDAITIEDRNGNLYNTYLTTTTLQPGSGQNIACNAKSAAKNSSTRYSQITQVYVTARKMVKAEKTAREKALEEFGKRIDSATGVYTTVEQQEDGSKIFYLHDKPTLAESQAVWKMTSEAWGVSTDGGQTWNGGMTVDGDTIVRILNAVGVNATWINAGAITVKDANENILFQVDMDTKTVVISPDVLIIGNMTLSKKLESMDESIASAKNMTFQLSNDMQTITSDADGNIPVFPTVTTTAKVMYGSSDITSDCSYTIAKSDSVTGSWNDSTHTYTVTGLSADNGWVDIKATYLINLSVTKRFTLAKQKQGLEGDKGLPGKSPTIRYASMPDGSDMSDNPKYVKLLDSAGNVISDSTGNTIYTSGEAIYVGFLKADAEVDSANPSDYEWSRYKGTDGLTQYTHLAYANSADGKTDFSVDNPNREYIGMYVDFTEADSMNPDDYAWSLIKGADGADGTPGKPGADGKTPYFHVAYANSEDGNTGFSVDDSTNKLYIGQYTDYEVKDSTDPTKYSWTKIKGNDGTPGRTYYLRANAGVLIMGQDKKIAPNPFNIHAYYRDGQGDETAFSTWWIVEYSKDAGKTWKKMAFNAQTSGITINPNNYSLGADGMIRATIYTDSERTKIADQQTWQVAVDVGMLTQEQIVEILSNDGEFKGLYYLNGHLYISFDAIMGNAAILGGAKNGNGYLKIKDANGAVKGIIDRSGHTVFTSYEENSKHMKYTGAQLSSDGIVPVDVEKFFDNEVDIEITNSEAWEISWDYNNLNIYATEMSANTGEFETLTVTDMASFTSSPKIENMEYTTASNTVCWDGRTGYKQLMLKSSSSKRYKDIGDNITESEVDEWYNIEPTWAKYKDGYLVKGDENEGRYIPMFIAEDVEEYFPEAARHANGQVEDWNERIMIPAMFAMIKAQKKKIDQQEKLINKLYEHLNLVKEI